MSNTIKWLAAISNEDGDKMSLGSLRTLNLIRKEHNELELQRQTLAKSMADVEKYAKDCCFDSHIQMKEAIENIIDVVDKFTIN